jgi:hypothetical protein
MIGIWFVPCADEAVDTKLSKCHQQLRQIKINPVSRPLDGTTITPAINSENELSRRTTNINESWCAERRRVGITRIHTESVIGSRWFGFCGASAQFARSLHD